MDMIDTLIKRSRFNKNQILCATQGQCFSFAIALYRCLKNRGIPCQIVGAEPKGDKGNWFHLMIESNGNYYDIRGKVSLKDIHKEYNTESMIPVSEEEVMKDLRYMIAHKIWPYNKKKDYIDKWENRLRLTDSDFVVA